MIDTSRHLGYFNPHNYKHKEITIIGAGATGSRVFEGLVNLGLTNITVFDFDDIEEHNLANQIYCQDDIGKAKVAALHDWAVKKTGDDTCRYSSEKVEGNMKNFMGHIVFLLTDTMASRKEIHKNSLWLNPKVEAVIETRMALTHGDVYQYNPNNGMETRRWNETLIEDDEAETSACGTALSVHTTASIIGNLAVSQLMHHFKGEPMPNHTSVFLHPLDISTSEWRERKAG